jgi:hypothetical protein
MSREMIKMDRERFKLQRKRVLSTNDKDLKEILSHLEVRSSTDAEKRLGVLLRTEQNFVHASKFIGKVNDLIQAHTPPKKKASSAATPPMTLNGMWRWVKRLVREYTMLQEGSLKSIVMSLVDVLGLTYPDDIPKLKDKMHLLKI